MYGCSFNSSHDQSADDVLPPKSGSSKSFVLSTFAIGWWRPNGSFFAKKVNSGRTANAISRESANEPHNIFSSILLGGLQVAVTVGLCGFVMNFEASAKPLLFKATLEDRSTASAPKPISKPALKLYGFHSGQATHVELKSKTELAPVWILQFESTDTRHHQEFFKAQKITPLRYIPQDAYLVRASDQKIASWGGNPQLSHIEVYSQEYKSASQNTQIMPDRNGNLSALESDRAHGTSASDFELLLVHCFPDVYLPSWVQDLTQQGVEVVQAGSSILYVKASQSVAPWLKRALARDHRVEWIQQAPLVDMMAWQPMAPVELSNSDKAELTGYESGTEIMGFRSAWSRGFIGKGQRGAVADTGLDTGDLETLNLDFAQVFKGEAFGLLSWSWADVQGHGTHVAGSVVGNGALSNGRIQGGAYGAELYAQGMWSWVIGNLAVPPELNKLFAPALANGVRVHSNSWGSPQNLGAYDSIAEQVDQFVWDNPEFLPVFAAGNSGLDKDRDGRVDANSISSPGTAKNALTVGASENWVQAGGIQARLGELLKGEGWPVEPLASDTLSNNPNGIAAFSSRGPTQDGRLKPDIVAPGTNVLSLCSSDPKASTLWGRYDAHYCYSGGTSMATPLTASAALVVRQYLIDELKLPRPSAALVKAYLMHTATDLYPGQFGFREIGQELLKPGPNPDQGYGRVNMDLATDRSFDVEVFDSESGVAAGEVWQYRMEAPLRGQKLKVTLVYSDAPGAASAHQSLVNDLDLYVDVDGTEYKSNDSINNHEQIEVSAAQGEAWVKVTGYRVPIGKNGRQPFAIVISRQ